MKKFKTIWVGLIFICFGCSEFNSDNSLESTIDDVEPNMPGPVTESDAQRYNLNTHDEFLYGRIDSTTKDSVTKDTL